MREGPASIVLAGLFASYRLTTARGAAAREGLRRLAYGEWSREPTAFDGTLLSEKRGASGTYYRRHWYHDLQTGRFTQEDPIGLAGGLNVYGFASGDPANFNDPFGLCPPIESCSPEQIASVMRRTGRMLQPAEGPLQVAGAIVTLPLGGPMGGAARARVALDANALIPLVEQAGSQAASAARIAMAGRAPSVSITVAKEFLQGGGDIQALRSFLQSSGGSVGRAASEALVNGLTSLGLKVNDARAVGSAITEGIEFLTRDKKILNKGLQGVSTF